MVKLRRLWSPFRREFIRNPLKHGKAPPWGYMLKAWHPRTWWMMARICWIARHAYNGRWAVWFVWCLGASIEVLIRGDVPRD